MCVMGDVGTFVTLLFGTPVKCAAMSLKHVMGDVGSFVSLFQDLLLSLSSRAFELGDLAEAVESEGDDRTRLSSSARVRVPWVSLKRLEKQLVKAPL